MNAARIIPAGTPAPPTVFAAISGVLHPSETTYELVNGRSPWTDGRSRYEGAPVLDEALQSWPTAKIVLTSTPSHEDDIQSVLDQMGTRLAARVVGYTYDDLVTKVKREVPTRSATTRTVGYSSNDYWRMSKAEIVIAHVAWSRPERWIVIDDEDILWPQDVRRDRLVLTDGCVGLRGAREQDRLHTVLLMNFGR